MAMKNNDLTANSIRQKMAEAMKAGDIDKVYDSFMEMAEQKALEILNGHAQQNDNAVLAARGKRTLTTAEQKYFAALSEAAMSDSPKQAIENMNMAFPVTIFEDVFEDLKATHPLLSKINFVNSTGAWKMLVNTAGVQTAVWGKLCDDVLKELIGGFKEVDGTLYKLSAFIPVCKPGLELSPAWMERYVREILYDAMAVGMEVGVAVGTGKEMPIGMDKDTSPTAAVVGGVFPEKEAIIVTDMDMVTMGNLMSLLAVSPSGRPRVVTDAILLVNPQDYYDKVMPATTIMAPDGSYRSTMPYDVTIIPTVALPRNKAILGSASRYFALAAMPKDGRIEYSDEYRFLEDERVYLIKLYAYGMPKDENSFLVLNIEGLTPKTYKVEAVSPATPSTDATLIDLRIGALTLSPTFDAEEDTYTAATTNATNTITATPANAGATVEIMVGDVSVNNGSAATWAEGANTVTITVTAADRTTTGVYTVTVTKS